MFSTILLAIVAVATAWSGYQSTRWSGEQAAFYALANAARVKAAINSTTAGQQSLNDAIMFNNWLNAYYNKQNDLAEKYKRRFRPEFLPAFTAWLSEDPFDNPGAPPGPLFMPEYELKAKQIADQYEKDAVKYFSDGQTANEISDRYVLVTVFLASVLFFVAIAQKFDWQKIQIVILILAFCMLLYGAYHLTSLPID